MEEKHTCISCVHFYRHYTKNAQGNYVPTTCGHCVFPRMKSRSIFTLACSSYLGREMGDAERRFAERVEKTV